eukprot:6194599-Pleurochrysis_carterae.AAC.3
MRRSRRRPQRRAGCAGAARHRGNHSRQGGGAGPRGRAGAGRAGPLGRAGTVGDGGGHRPATAGRGAGQSAGGDGGGAHHDGLGVVWRLHGVHVTHTLRGPRGGGWRPLHQPHLGAVRRVCTAVRVAAKGEGGLRDPFGHNSGVRVGGEAAEIPRGWLRHRAGSARRPARADPEAHVPAGPAGRRAEAEPRIPGRTFPRGGGCGGEGGHGAEPHGLGSGPPRPQLAAAGG